MDAPGVYCLRDIHMCGGVYVDCRAWSRAGRGLYPHRRVSAVNTVFAVLENVLASQVSAGAVSAFSAIPETPDYIRSGTSIPSRFKTTSSRPRVIAHSLRRLALSAALSSERMWQAL